VSGLSSIKRSHDALKLIIPAVCLSMVGFWLAYQFVDPAPPTHLTMATGEEGGAYVLFAQQYRAILARHDVTLHIRRTAGSQENLTLLQAEPAEVDVALVQSGVRDRAAPTPLTALGSVYFEPLWLFCRRDLVVHRLFDLRHKRFAIGPEGSGTRSIALQALAANALMAPDVELLPWGGQEAVKGLRSGAIDAAFVVASPLAPVVHTLLTAEDIALIPFARAEAFRRVHRFLAKVMLPEGAIDFAKNIPSRDVPLLAPAANLVVRHDFHPALVSLLLQAAEEVHGKGDLFAEPGQFPSTLYVDFPLNNEARRYFKSGPSFLRRYLSFWVATLIERLWVMLLPLAAILLPFMRFFPPAYRWRVRSRIYRWYRALLAINPALQTDASPERCTAYLDELNRIEQDISQLSVPLAYADQFYNLHMHIELVRQKVRQAQGRVNT
jgi:TRAP transporter TAXI family solute receptor